MSPTRYDAPVAPAAAPLFSVVVPTTGSEAKLLPLLEGLARQTLPRERWEAIVVFDGAEPTPAVAARLVALAARIVEVEPRQGPPIARNRGAAEARGEFLVSADDDVVPEPEWLERAAGRFAAEPELDVLEGVTRKPGGRPVRIRGDESPQYILCNLFVRRRLFERIGGFHEGYFDPESGVFFREDADLGYTLEAAGARVSREPGAVVTHPIEHPRFLDPLRWAERYEMDPLLQKRYPKLFRERIEIHRLGPFTIRRPIVRASLVYVVALAGAVSAALFGLRAVAWGLLALTALAFLPIWAKWRFELKRLPVFALVPFALLAALARGRARVRRLGLG
jgi:glycosyltransferase involved in cell wall biosynthesis